MVHLLANDHTRVIDARQPDMRFKPSCAPVCLMTRQSWLSMEICTPSASQAASHQMSYAKHAKSRISPSCRGIHFWKVRVPPVL